MRPIDADAIKLPKGFFEAVDNVPKLYEWLNEQPTIDAVTVGAYEQTRWERDMAISQLEEIGKSLCEKMDNVATVVRCKDCKHRDAENGFCEGRGWPMQLVPDDGFCDKGER